jgi:hypothetical protein
MWRWITQLQMCPADMRQGLLALVECPTSSRHNEMGGAFALCDHWINHTGPRSYQDFKICQAAAPAVRLFVS